MPHSPDTPRHRPRPVATIEARSHILAAIQEDARGELRDILAAWARAARTSWRAAEAFFKMFYLRELHEDDRRAIVDELAGLQAAQSGDLAAALDQLACRMAAAAGIEWDADGSFEDRMELLRVSLYRRHSPLLPGGMLGLETPPQQRQGRQEQGQAGQEQAGQEEQDRQEQAGQEGQNRQEGE